MSINFGIKFTLSVRHSLKSRKIH